MPIVFKGRVFAVEVSSVRYPDGREHRQEIVRHPPSVVLIPLGDDGRVILVRQFRSPLGFETWELPAGGVNDGESADDAARRESEEEIGLVPDHVQRICGLFPSPGFCDEELIYFRVSGLRPPPAGSPHGPDEDEDIHSGAFSIAEAKAMVARGEIVDLKTAYGLTLI